MNEVPNEGEFEEEEDAPREQSPTTRMRSFTLVQDSTPERKFNELILAINSMMRASTTMQISIWGFERSLRDKLPPTSYQRL